MKNGLPVSCPIGAGVFLGTLANAGVGQKTGGERVPSMAVLSRVGNQKYVLLFGRPAISFANLYWACRHIVPGLRTMDQCQSYEIQRGRNQSMATVPSYAEQQASLKEKGLIESLMDFSFQRMVTPCMLKMLYSLHLLLGLIIAIGFVFKG